jgi:hypothetical protein
VIEQEPTVDADERRRASHLGRREDGELEPIDADAPLVEPRQLPLCATEGDQRRTRIGRTRGEWGGSVGRHVGVHVGSRRLVRSVERRSERIGWDSPFLVFC